MLANTMRVYALANFTVELRAKGVLLADLRRQDRYERAILL
jgi:hypothetical protein